MDSATIAIKLKEFLRNHPKFERACEVVYLMVEIRKILDFQRGGSALLRLYCNWVLHNQLDKPYTTAILSQKFSINNINQLSAREIARKLKSGRSAFFELNDFNNELKIFFKTYRLPMAPLNNHWAQFRTLFLDVITECPVIFTSSRLYSLELRKKDNLNYEYKFTLTQGRYKPVIKLKFK